MSCVLCAVWRCVHLESFAIENMTSLEIYIEKAKMYSSYSF